MILGIILAAWEIFRIPDSARPMVLNEIDPSDVIAVTCNPALTSRFKNKKIETVFKYGFRGDILTEVSYTNRKFAYGVLYYLLGTETLYWVEDGVEKSENVKLEEDFLAFFSYSTFAPKDRVYYGINMKLANSKITHYSANAVAIDLAATFMERDSYLTLSINNIGFTQAYIEKKENLPLYFRIGYGAENRKFFFGFDISYIPEGTKLLLGTAVSYRKNEAGLFAGYKLEYRNRKFLEPIGAFQFGFNIKKNYELSYSIAPFSPISIIHKFSISYIIK